MSKAKVSPDPLQRVAQLVLRKEMRAYDAMSRRSRIVYEHAAQQAIDDGALGPTYVCGHGIMLFNPCDKCTRTIEECEVYQRAAMTRIKDLLAILETKTVSKTESEMEA